MQDETNLIHEINIILIFQKQAPEPDAVRIQDEVKRLASKCTCDKQFKIHKVGEGKYKVSWSYLLLLSHFFCVYTFFLAIFFTKIDWY